MSDGTVRPLRSLIHEDSPARLCISLPAPRNPVMMLALLLGLLFWAVIFVNTLGVIAANLAAGPMTVIVLLIWLAGWLAGGAVALAALLWMGIGREIITLTSDSLTLRRDLRGYGHSQAYKLRHLENLRTDSDPSRFADYFTTLRPFGIGCGPITFDYLGQGVRFGAGIAAGEAEMVRDRLLQRLAAAPDRPSA